MASTDYTDYLPEILPKVKGCPEQVAVNAVRNALIELCDRAPVWRYEHDPLSSMANEGVYDFEPPTGGEVVKILQAWYDGKSLTPMSEDQLHAAYSDYRTADGTPEYYTQDDQTQIILVPRPTTALVDAIKMIVQLKPTIASTNADTRLYNRYREQVARGALARLFDMGGESWADPDKADRNLTLFNADIVSASSAAQQNYGRARQRVPAQFF